MRFLIRLYPRAWRDRYGVEFEELLRQESIGLSAILDIVASALRLRALGLFEELQTARADAVKTFKDLPALSRFALIMAGLDAFTGWAGSRFSAAGGALLVSTTIVIVLKLLSRTANESDAFKSRAALMLMVVPAVTSHFWGFSDRLHPQASAAYRPSILGLIVALSVCEAPLPARDRLALLQVGTWLCAMQAAAFPSAAALSLVSWKKAAIFGAFWAVFAIFQHRQRAALASRIDSEPSPLRA